MAVVARKSGQPRTAVIAVWAAVLEYASGQDARGNVAEAARALGMSYRRAWLLVETMNRSFRQPGSLSLVSLQAPCPTNL